MFDDNYLPEGGDNFSPKAACAASALAAGRTKPFRFGDFRFSPRKPAFTVTARQLDKIHASFRRVVLSYQEMPPLWPGPNRHQLDGESVARTMEPPLRSNNSGALQAWLEQAGLGASLRSLEDESRAYTFFSYVQLRSAVSPNSQGDLFWPQHIRDGDYVSPLVVARPDRNCRGGSSIGMRPHTGSRTVSTKLSVAARPKHTG
mgnify:CR=1 FL=1